MTISEMLGRPGKQDATLDADADADADEDEDEYGGYWTGYRGFRVCVGQLYHGNFFLEASSSSSLIRACLASSMISSSVLICNGVSHLFHSTVSFQPLFTPLDVSVQRSL
jgi:hypothetical protein